MNYRHMHNIDAHAIYSHRHQSVKDVDPNCKDFSDIVENSSLKIITAE
jgi:hypothetical protein